VVVVVVVVVIVVAVVVVVVGCFVVGANEGKDDKDSSSLGVMDGS